MKEVIEQFMSIGFTLYTSVDLLKQMDRMNLFVTGTCMKNCITGSNCKIKSNIQADLNKHTVQLRLKSVYN